MTAHANQVSKECDESCTCSTSFGTWLIYRMTERSPNDSSELNDQEVIADSSNIPNNGIAFPVIAVAMPLTKLCSKIQSSDMNPAAASSNSHPSSSESASVSNDFNNSSQYSSRPSQDSSKLKEYNESKRRVRVLNGIASNLLQP